MATFRAALKSALNRKGGLAEVRLADLLQADAEDYYDDEEEEEEEDEEEEEEEEEEDPGLAQPSVNTNALARILKSLTSTNCRLSIEASDERAQQRAARSTTERRDAAEAQIRRIAARNGLRVEVFRDDQVPPALAVSSIARAAATAAPTAPPEARPLAPNISAAPSSAAKSLAARLFNTAIGASTKCQRNVTISGTPSAIALPVAAAITTQAATTEPEQRISPRKHTRHAASFCNVGTLSRLSGGDKVQTPRGASVMAGGTPPAGGADTKRQAIQAQPPFVAPCRRSVATTAGGPPTARFAGKKRKAVQMQPAYVAPGRRGDSTLGRTSTGLVAPKPGGLQ